MSVAEPASPSGAEPASPSGPAHRRLMTVLFLGTFMAALDTAIVAPAVPALRASFGADNRQIGLVTIVFSLLSLPSTALMARLGDRFGRRAVYLFDVAVFALGSFVVAEAGSFGVLLAGRALQGLGAGGITPTASAVVGDVYPPAQRGRVLGLVGATFGMAFLFGPVLASALLVVGSWSWIFLINLPLAAVVLVLAARSLPEAPARAARPPFDTLGMSVLALSLAGLMLGINQALDRVLGLTVWPALLALAAAGLGSLVVIERRAAEPIVPLELFGAPLLRRTWLLCVGSGFGMGSVIFVTSVAVEALGTSAQHAGLLLLPLVLFSSVASAGFGRALQRLGPRTVMRVGFGLLAAGALGLAALPDTLVGFLVATSLVGAGVGVVVGGTLRTVVLDATRAEVRGAAQALVNITISVGNLLVVATLGAVADLAGGGLVGLRVAYGVAAAVMGVMGLAAGRLPGRVERA